MKQQKPALCIEFQKRLIEWKFRLNGSTGRVSGSLSSFPSCASTSSISSFSMSAVYCAGIDGCAANDVCVCVLV